MVKVIKACTSHEIEKCLSIRRKVFIESQGVSEDEELDGKDGISDHFLLILNNKDFLGTARVRFVGRKAKVERVAILNGHQGKGLGTILMKYIIEQIKNSKKADVIFLSSQKAAVSFYYNLGFSLVSGREYLDAGIVHQDMQLII